MGYMLTERQQRILGLVAEEYLESGKPVGSKALAERPDVTWSASTIRNELAALERDGFLTHPHTSAGRVPTDRGYRFYADALLAAGATRTNPVGELGLTRMRAEVEEAMRETTAALSRVTDLLAVATAPPPSVAHIHRVEVLRLQPKVAMVVVIASNGAVAKRVFSFEEELDTGLVEWASSYLNESLTGLSLGARMIADRLADPSLSPPEANFLARIKTAFTHLEQRAGEDLYVDGAARLLSEEYAPDLPEIESLMEALERRANLLHVLRSALDEKTSVFVWIGSENPAPELRSVSVVGANYGLGYRNLGTVGVVGPLRMDYATAIASVRHVAGELSRFFEDVYEPR
jgi:heat-inducible transcriptional repressor